MPPLPPLRNLWVALARAARLRCPECGAFPIFKPARKAHSLRDWLTPLPGCPRCRYACEREPGYFLVATWFIQFCVVVLVGVAAALFLLSVLESVWLVVAITWALTLVFVFIRYAKAIYLAFDHYVAPQAKAQLSYGVPMETDPTTQGQQFRHGRR